MSKRSTRLFAGFLSTVYFMTQAVFASAAESGFWAERRRELNRNKDSSVDAPSVAGLPSGDASVQVLQGLPSLEPRPLSPALSGNVAGDLPPGFLQKNAAILNALPSIDGTIRRVSLPPGGSPSRVVIHVQDVHMNAEAQARIGEAVQSLIDKKAVGWVGLEGAFQPVDLGRYRAFPDHEAVRKTADALLRDDKISGPIHSAFIGAGDVPPFIGVDDPAHYDANVDAYRRSAPLVGEYKARLAVRRADLARRKGAAFNGDLKAFDDKIEDYRGGKSALGDYVKLLAGRAPGPLSPSIRDFVEALDMEASLDFKRVESERARLVDRLIRRLDPEQVKALMNRSLAYRLGQVRYADFYRSLRDLCERNGVPLAGFPAMDGYVRYVLLADRISAEKLFDDAAALEKECYARLAKTRGEKALVVESVRLDLTGKLVDFALTPRDWGEYEALRRPEQSEGPSPATPLHDHPGGGGLLGPPMTENDKTPLDLSSFEDFYREAQARDEAMARNVLREMEARATSAVVLVTGGYHSPGLMERLTKAGCAVVSFTPKLEKADAANGSAYLSVFTQEKTPLEKLFQGEKLFLSPKQMTPARELEAAADVALAVELEDPRTPSDGERVLSALSPSRQGGYHFSTRDLPGRRAEGMLTKTGAPGAVALDAQEDRAGELVFDPERAVAVSFSDRMGAFAGAAFRKMFTGIGRAAFAVRHPATEASARRDWIDREVMPRLETPMVLAIAFAPPSLRATMGRWYVSHYHVNRSAAQEARRFQHLARMVDRAREMAPGTFFSLVFIPVVFAALFEALRRLAGASAPVVVAGALLSSVSVWISAGLLSRGNLPLHQAINGTPGEVRMSGQEEAPVPKGRVYPVGDGHFVFMKHGSRGDFEAYARPSLEDLFKAAAGKKDGLVVLHDTGYQPAGMTIGNLVENYQEYARDHKIPLAKDPVDLLAQMFRDEGFGREAYAGYKIGEWQKREQESWDELAEGNPAFLSHPPESYWGGVAAWVESKPPRSVRLRLETYTPERWWASMAAQLLKNEMIAPERFAAFIPKAGMDWFKDQYRRLAALETGVNRDSIKQRNRSVRDSFNVLTKNKRSAVAGVMGLYHMELASSKARVELLREREGLMDPPDELMLRQFSSASPIDPREDFVFYPLFYDLFRAYRARYPEWDDERVQRASRARFDGLAEAGENRDALLAEFLEKLRRMPPNAPPAPLLSWEFPPVETAGGVRLPARREEDAHDADFNALLESVRAHNKDVGARRESLIDEKGLVGALDEIAKKPGGPALLGDALALSRVLVAEGRNPTPILAALNGLVFSQLSSWGTADNKGAAKPLYGKFFALAKAAASVSGEKRPDVLKIISHDVLTLFVELRRRFPEGASAEAVDALGGVLDGAVREVSAGLDPWADFLSGRAPVSIEGKAVPGASAAAGAPVEVLPPVRAYAGGGILFPYNPGGLGEAPNVEAGPVVSETRGKWEEGRQALNQKFEARKLAIRKNFAVFDVLMGGSEGEGKKMTRERAERALYLTRSMLGYYAVISPQTAERVRADLDRLEGDVSRLSADLRPEDPLPAEAVDKLLLPGRADTLNGIIRRLHRLVLEDFHEEARKAGTDVLIRSRNHRVEIANMEDAPFLNGTWPVSRPFRAFLRGMESARSGDEFMARVVVKGDYLSASVYFGNHFADLDCELTDPAEGGYLTLSFNDGGHQVAEGRPAMLAAALESSAGMRKVLPEHPDLLRMALDKDHGALNAASIEKALEISSRLLASVKGIDYLLAHHFKADSLQPRGRIIDTLGLVLAGEGRVPDDYGPFAQDVPRSYADREQSRQELRRMVNARLADLGLPQVPASTPFGQLTVDRLFGTPVRRGLARGEFKLTGDGMPVRNDAYDPLGLLVGRLKDGNDVWDLAGTLNTLDPGVLDFSPVGGIGALPAVRAELPLKGGEWLIVQGLVDPASGQLLAADARIATEAAGPTAVLSPSGLVEKLRGSGHHVSFDEGPVGAARGWVKGEMKSAPPSDGRWQGRVARGLPCSAGSAIGRVTFDPKESAGKVLIAMDPDGAENAVSAAAVVTTGGTPVNHVALVLREKGVPWTILPQSRWDRRGDGVSLLRLFCRVVERPRLHPDGYLLWRGSVRERVIREGDPLIVDGSAGVVTVLTGQGSRSYVKRALKVLYEREFSPEDLASLFSNPPSTGALDDALDVVLHEAANGSIDLPPGRKEAVLQLLRQRPWLDMVEERVKDAKKRMLEKFRGDLQRSMDAVRKSLPRATTVRQLARSEESLAARERELKRLGVRLSLKTSLPKGFRQLEKDLKLRREALVRQAQEEILRLGAKPLEEAAPEVKKWVRVIRRNPPFSGLRGPRPAADGPDGKRAAEVDAFIARVAAWIAEKAASLRSKPRFIYFLSDVDEEYADLVGEKAARLGEVAKVEGLEGHLLKGFDISTEAFRQVLEKSGREDEYVGLTRELDVVLASEAADDVKMKGVTDLSDRLRALVASLPLSADSDAGRRVMGAIDSQGFSGSLLAVRSSAVQEDKEEASFAGMGKTSLAVPADRVLEEIKGVWSSFWEPRGIFYRHQANVRQADLRPAVLVQQMAGEDGEEVVSGVMFTEDPVTGAEETQISASYGLEGVTSGKGGADTYYLEGGEEVRPYLPGSKMMKLTLDDGGGKLEHVQRRARHHRALSAAQTKALADIGARLKKHFGMGLDVEFAVGVKSGRLWITQVRPITARAPSAKAARTAPSGPAAASLGHLLKPGDVKWTLGFLAGELAVFGLGGLARVSGWGGPWIGGHGFGVLMGVVTVLYYGLHVGFLVKRYRAGEMSGQDVWISLAVYTLLFGAYLVVPWFPGRGFKALLWGMGFHALYDATMLYAAPPPDAELPAEARKAVEACVRAAAENRKELASASAALVEAARSPSFIPTGPRAIVIGHYEGKPLRAILPEGHFPDGFKVSFESSGGRGIASGAIMRVSGNPEGGPKIFLFYDLSKPTVPYELHPIVGANWADSSEVPEGIDLVNHLLRGNAFHLPELDRASHRPLTAEEIAPLVLEKKGQVEKALSELQFDARYAVATDPRTKVLEHEGKQIILDMVFNGTYSIWACRIPDMGTAIKALGLTPRENGGPSGSEQGPAGNGEKGGGAKGVPSSSARRSRIAPASLGGLLKPGNVKWTLGFLAGELAVFGLGGLARVSGWGAPWIGGHGFGVLMGAVTVLYHLVHVGVLFRRYKRGDISAAHLAVSLSAFTVIFAGYLVLPWLSMPGLMGLIGLMGAQVLYDVIAHLLTPLPDVVLPPDAQKAVEAYVRTATTDRRRMGEMALVLKRRNPFSLVVPDGHGALILGYDEGEAMRAILPNYYFPEGLQVRFQLLGQESDPAGAVMVISGKTRRGHEGYWVYDFSRTRVQYEIEPSFHSDPNELAEYLKMMGFIREDFDKKIRGLPPMNRATHRSLTVEELIPLVLEGEEDVFRALEENHLEPFFAEQGAPRTRTLRDGLREIPLVFVDSGIDVNWAFKISDTAAIIRALGLTPKDGDGPSGSSGEGPQGNGSGGGAKVISISSARGAETPSILESSSLLNRARSDAERAFRVLSSGREASEDDVHALLVPPAETEGVGKLLRRDPGYRRAFVEAFRALALKAGKKVPRSGDVFGTLIRIAGAATSSDSFDGPHIQVIEMDVLAKDIPAARALVWSTVRIASPAGEGPSVLVRLVPAEADPARREELGKALDRLAGGNPRVSVRRIASEEITAKALETDFKNWASDPKQNLKGAALRLAVSVSAGVVVKGSLDGDSLYARALRAALSAMPLRPMDFGNIMAIAAAVAEAA